DSDIVLVPDSGTEPTWEVRQAREFGRRGNRRSFEKWLCQQTSHPGTWPQLRAEFERAKNEHQPIEAWRKVFREGVAVQLSVPGLQGLLAALRRDDVRIVTGTTTVPPALGAMATLPLEAADPIAWALLDGARLTACSVGLMDECFARLAIRC